MDEPPPPLHASQMVSGLDAVVNVSMHSEGRYAFVELRTPEMASAALQVTTRLSVEPGCLASSPQAVCSSCRDESWHQAGGISLFAQCAGAAADVV